MMGGLSNEEYIRFVNEAVRRGEHNRPIRVVYTKQRPKVGDQRGVASHVNYKYYDRVSVWRGLPKNEVERRAYEERASKKFGRPMRAITREEALRHELWHVHRPYESERKVRGVLEYQRLPRELPTRRRI